MYDYSKKQIDYAKKVANKRLAAEGVNAPRVLVVPVPRNSAFTDFLPPYPKGDIRYEFTKFNENYFGVPDVRFKLRKIGDTLRYELT